MFLLQSHFFNLNFALQCCAPAFRVFCIDKSYRAPGACVLGSLSSIVLSNPGFYIGGDSSVETVITALHDVDVPAGIVRVQAQSPEMTCSFMSPVTDK